MASVGRLGQVILRVGKSPKWSPAVLVPSRSKAFYNKDFQPGPYPETEAERRAAAKKYNMLYEDYKPYPKDIMNAVDYPLGDYPQLEAFGEWSRDPHGDYDFLSSKRFYGEPLHIQADAYYASRYDKNARLKVPMWKQGCILFGTFFGLLGLALLCEYYDIRLILQQTPAKKQYPQDGVVHYTFEPAE